MRPITIKEVEYLAFELVKRHMEWSEPIPDFSTRYPGILESCVANAFQTYGRKKLYPTLLDKAAMIFYQMIKDHPFINLPAPQQGNYYVYALKCADNSIYIGYTNNLTRRIKEHKNRLNSWTKSRLPIVLIHAEAYKSKEDAVSREKKLKTGFGRKWLKKKASRQAGGNKRIAVTTLLIFLALNDKWIEFSNEQLYNLAFFVAESQPKLKKSVVLFIKDSIRYNLVPFKD